MSVELIVFYCFSALLIGSALMVVWSENPVRGVLFLVLSFFSASILWMLLQAEFLALALIFVYVGAVMTLFLFVVMMLNVKQAAQMGGFVKYLPIALIVMAILVSMMLYVLHTHYFDTESYAQLIQKPANYSNVKVLGHVLYTQYAYAFEIAGVILLVAIISAIGLAFRGRRKGTKAQVFQDQMRASKSDRLTLIQSGFKKYEK